MGGVGAEIDKEINETQQRLKTEQAYMKTQFMTY